MKKLLILLFSIFLLSSPSVFAEELIFLHCSRQSDGGSRNIIIDKNGQFFISHESIKYFRKDETFAGLEAGLLKDLPVWIFGDDSGKTYDSLITFNYKNLEYAATGFKKGEYEKAYENLDNNNHFCFPIENPFQD